MKEEKTVEEKIKPVKEKTTLKEKIRKIFSFLFVLMGLCLLFYPWISDYVNQHQADAIIDAYSDEIDKADENVKEALINEAREYNKTLLDGQVKLTEPFEESTIDTFPYIYEKMLSLNGSDVMSTVQIPTINVNLPVYHGTSDEVLEKGVGHLKGSSLPVGGKNTHAVLTGHTGLSNAKLFTDLTEVQKGDIFFVNTLNLKLAYKVVSIHVVKPEDTRLLMVVPGEDLCTLVTCTPYGVNSHRLFVRGERTEYNEDDLKPKKVFDPRKSLWMRTYAMAIAIGLAIVTVIVITVTIIRRRRRKNIEKVSKLS